MSKRNSSQPQFVNPNFDGAEEFNAYVAEVLDGLVSEDDFGGGYAWDTEVPTADQWGEAVGGLVDHINSMWFSN